ncbi:hypothetical protein V6N13_059992 [Hibiscus sabdariffa]|uniref:RING-type domain-containing protein n=1 Tax=Hibiscus sabdariffa TaxID=183260 RepID=A0ABR2GCG0_9ROSI
MPLSQPGTSPLTIVKDDGGHAFQYFISVLIGLLGVIAGAIVVATYHLIHSICNCYRRPTVEAASAYIRQNIHQTQHKRSRESQKKRESFNDAKADSHICLGGVKKGEQIWVLPDCLHFFHVGCIDKWLNSHSNCPLIVSVLFAVRKGANI